MALISPSILSLEFFCKNSIYLRVRLRERFVNPQLLKQLAVYKIKEHPCKYVYVDGPVFRCIFFTVSDICVKKR